MVSHTPTRRAFLRGAATLTGSLVASRVPAHAEGAATTPAAQVFRQPDAVIAFSGLNSPLPLNRQAYAWTSKGIQVGIEPAPRKGELSIQLTSADIALSHLHLRWTLRNPADLRCVGDAWERSYGDLEWRGIVPERVLPWYFMTFHGGILCGYGVKTQPSAFCFWQLDLEGISLWADIRNGGSPLALGQRQLEVATIVTYTGQPAQPPFAAAQEFCRRLSPTPRLPAQALCGSNDWNYAYGKNTADGILRDADLIAQVAFPSGPRPYVVADDGWQDRKRFPDLTALAAGIRSRGLRPGIWVRPLRAPSDAKTSLLLPESRFAAPERPTPAWDPTIPEALEMALNAIRQPVSWGYHLIKHDFSTFELLGRWGSRMGALPTDGDWHFADRSLTTAEIIVRFYRSLRTAAGDDVVILGCNTVGHLCAGIFESHRIGDDTSGTKWERTRRMGVNTLAFRLPQHRTFFHVDPDCVALTRDVDWFYTRQWLDVVSHSGSSLFISPARDAIGPEQIAALKDAFARVRNSAGYAEDWLDNTAPAQWRFELGTNQRSQYDWSGATGSFPFPV